MRRPVLQGRNDPVRLMSKRKYTRGGPITSLTQLATEIEQGRCVFVRGKVQNPAWLQSMTYRALLGQVKRGDMYYAERVRDPKEFLRALKNLAREIRAELEPYFSAETCLGEFNPEIPSAGHSIVASLYLETCTCLLPTAALVHLYSTTVQGLSHWFLRVTDEGSGEDWDVDITADEFGSPPILIAPAGELYAHCELRHLWEIPAETWDRYYTLTTYKEDV